MRIEKLKNYFIQWKMKLKNLVLFSYKSTFSYIYIIYFIFIKEFIIDYK